MNLKQLLKNAGVSNDIIKEVEKKSKKTTEQQELEHQEKALAMTKMMINEALRHRKEHGKPGEPPATQKTIIIPD
jgi:hypothetical protein